jgi:hypothetical protein
MPSVVGKDFGSVHYVDVFFEVAAASQNFYWGEMSLVAGDCTTEPISSRVGRRHIQQELALCQRYYQKAGFGFYFDPGLTGLMSQRLQYPVVMRVSPSVSVPLSTFAGVSGGAAGASVDSHSQAGCNVYVSGVGAGTALRALGTYTADAEL